MILACLAAVFCAIYTGRQKSVMEFWLKALEDENARKDNLLDSLKRKHDAARASLLGEIKRLKAEKQELEAARDAWLREKLEHGDAETGLRGETERLWEERSSLEREIEWLKQEHKEEISSLERQAQWLAGHAATLCGQMNSCMACAYGDGADCSIGEGMEDDSEMWLDAARGAAMAKEERPCA